MVTVTWMATVRGLTGVATVPVPLLGVVVPGVGCGGDRFVAADSLVEPLTGAGVAVGAADGAAGAVVLGVRRAGYRRSSSSVAMRDRWISRRRQCSSSGSGKRSASR